MSEPRENYDWDLERPVLCLHCGRRVVHGHVDAPTAACGAASVSESGHGIDHEADLYRR